MKDFRDLVVWRKAHLLTLAAYEATAGFPKQELFGMTSRYADAQLPLRPILRKDVVGVEMLSFSSSWALPPGRQANWNIISC